MSHSTKKKERADLLVVSQGLADSRARAQAYIFAGEIFCAGQRVAKPGSLLPRESVLEHKSKAGAYVSRGGNKLAGALQDFSQHGLDPKGKVVLDIGASTGGFTDCVLQNGATKVYAVDVGYGQLHAKLRSDERVVCRERENARHLQASSFDERPQLIVIDASFIGIGALAPAMARVLAEGGELCALIKPQFEAGRDAVRKNRGVIRDPDVRAAAIEKARKALDEHGFDVRAGSDCKVKGPKGNREYFFYAIRNSKPAPEPAAPPEESAE